MTFQQEHKEVPDREAHWYNANGEPVYTLPKKDGTGDRWTTIRDAKALHLRPSVTNIMGMVNKPGLEAWKLKQAVLSAISLDRSEEYESKEDFAQRVFLDSLTETRRAANFGTSVHKMVEGYLTGEIPDELDAFERVFLEGFMPWFQQNKVEPWALEKSFATEDYGGRLDFMGSINGVFVIADWKTQATKPDEPIVFWPEWPVQLKAYKKGVDADDALLMSLVISSTEVGRVQPYVWLEEDWYWDCFESAKQLYYSPLGPGSKLR